MFSEIWMPLENFQIMKLLCARCNTFKLDEIFYRAINTDRYLKKCLFFFVDVFKFIYDGNGYLHIIHMTFL